MPRADYSTGYNIGRIDMYDAIHKVLEQIWDRSIDGNGDVKFKDLIEEVEKLQPPHSVKPRVRNRALPPLGSRRGL